MSASTMPTFSPFAAIDAARFTPAEADGLRRAMATFRHNGTIYRWNRPIYDVFRGRPHLRVENRVLPAGPTVVDILANGAFYYGLLKTLAAQDRPVWSQMSKRSTRCSSRSSCM